MLNSFQIGAFRVSNIVEYFGPTHDPAALYPEFDRSVIEHESGWLLPDHYSPILDRLVIGIQVWVLHAGDRVVVVDTGVGNHKLRGVPRMDNLNTLFLTWLAAADAPREKVTDVVMTHLHSDHVGWNTMLVDNRWEPTFPNARYHIPKVDLDHFTAIREAGKPADAGSLADSVTPILEAGLAELIVDQSELLDVLRIVPAPGHTPGMLNYWIESGGQQAVFSADIMHHPLQIVRPDWNTAFCMLPTEAKQTRAAFLARAADAEALIMPCHFGPPHCGYARRQGDGFVFEPTKQTRIL